MTNNSRIGVTVGTAGLSTHAGAFPPSLGLHAPCFQPQSPNISRSRPEGNLETSVVDPVRAQESLCLDPLRSLVCPRLRRWNRPWMGGLTVVALGLMEGQGAPRSGENEFCLELCVGQFPGSTNADEASSVLPGRVFDEQLSA